MLQRFTDTFMKDVNLGVMLIGLDYTVISVNEKACAILGCGREQMIRRPVDDIFAAVPEQHRLVQRTMLDGVIVRNHAVSWTNHDRRYDLLLDSNVLRDPGGRIVGAYVMFKDVTNLRSLEAQVQRSDRLAMIGQIAAGTAHEIRNPLTSIKGFLQLLRATFEQREMAKERSFTDVMLSEIDRINELVSEFLLLSKQKEALLAEVDIQHVLRGILPIIESEALLHNCEVQYEPLPSVPPVTADQEMLKQVFLNICKNGIEAMPDGGILTIAEKLDQGDRKLLIDIRDTGPGIPLFLVDKIFDPFFTTKEHGTGLGLSVCQRIIHDIGGTIRVSSKGYGTTFTIGIPFS
ncbi:diguanylate cyclase [Gordoniibacillus kamchatkensis]|uniref:histidine kinase n=1 Tax=Gordoniibacillus kamchatkensis TaxID=1590651 RepID=A0ABR5ACD9_9BACL|nr:diguanylate cyclase [Paenibacillus sp. VKM B-2647]